VHDDLHSIVNNPPLGYHSNPLDFFTKPELFSGTKAEMYRPLLQLSYVFNFKLGDSPYGFRLFNLILHLLCAWLVFFLTRSMPCFKKASLVAALLFALHPVHSGTIIYISSRSTLLASFFILLGLLAFIKAVNTEKSSSVSWLLGLASALCLAAGLMSKSIAITLPAFAFTYLIFFPAQRKGRGLLLVLLFLGISAGYILLRYTLDLYTLFPPERPRPVIENLLTQTRVAFFYLRVLLMPVHLSLEYDMARVKSLFDPRFWLSIAGWTIIFIAALKSERRREIIFSMLFFFIALAPTSTLVSLVVIASERRLYLASLGLIWPLSILFMAAIENRKTRAAGILIFVLFLACFAGLASSRGMVWKSSHSLWRDTVTKAPGLARAHTNYGIELKNMGLLNDAAREYRMAIKLDPMTTWSYNNLANIYSEQGKYDESKEAYGRALEIAPGNVNARMNLGHLLVDMGEYDEAAGVLEEAVFIAPYRADIRHDLGIIYMRYLKNWNRAREHLELSLEQDPGQRDAQMMRRAMEELKKLESIQEAPVPRAQ
jgi:tetratricopeptide (TPR) repeat protein